MKDEHARFSGSILAAYDRYLGPVLFQRYAEDLTWCKACGDTPKGFASKQPPLKGTRFDINPNGKTLP